jgi:hypothetical protein
MGLRSQAAKLVEGVALFKLDDSSSAGSRHREPPRAMQMPKSLPEQSNTTRAAA